jgi:PST family polysaccharide transporter
MKLKKNFLQHSDIKSLFKNIFSISAVKIFDYILPILVIPYIVRIIGVTNFGKVSVAQSFISYFSILINFGFNYSITREIAINREDKKKLSSLFSTTIFTKLGFFFYKYSSYRNKHFLHKNI